MYNITLEDLKNRPVISGIYKINYPNNKVYIGQSKNIYFRIREHNQRARTPRKDRKDLPSDLAIRKYGQITKITILQETNNLEELDTLEKYWILYFKSNEKEYGYNICLEGNVSGKRGCDNSNSKINEKQLQEIITLLQNNYELSMKNIADKFNISYDTVFGINSGLHYVNPKLNYPLRNKNDKSYTRNSWKEYFKTEEELINFKEALIYDWDLKIEKDFVNKYNVPLAIIREINNGKRFQEIGNFKYPLRPINKSRNIHNLTKQDIINILSLLRNTNLSMTEIGKRFNNISRKTISDINNGINYPIKNYNYPARITKK